MFEEEEEEVIQPNYRNDLENPKWIEDKIFKDKHDYDKDNGKVDYLTGEEIDFWKNLISKYLTPFEKKFSRKDFKKKAAETKRELYEYRDSFIFGFLMINCFYIVLITMLQVINQSPISHQSVEFMNNGELPPPGNLHSLHHLLNILGSDTSQDTLDSVVILQSEWSGWSSLLF